MIVFDTIAIVECLKYLGRKGRVETFVSRYVVQL